MLVNGGFMGAIKSPNRSATVDAIEFQSWLQSHVSMSLNCNYAKDKVLNIAKAMLPEEKCLDIGKLIKSPIPSNDILQKCYQRLGEVKRGRNQSRHISKKSEVYSEAAEKDLENWLIEQGHESNFKNDSFEIFKNAPNSIIWLDSSAEGGEPYYTFKDISKLWAFKLKPDAVGFEWIVLKDSEKRFIGADSQNYYVAELTDIGIVELDPIPHKAGTCPARFLWSDYADYSNKVTKETPVLNQLDKLDWFNFNTYELAIQETVCIDPILAVAETTCDYSKSEIRTVDGIESQLVYNCNGGRLYDFYGVDYGKCPVCSKKLNGAGIKLSVPPNMSGKPAEYISPNIESVKYKDTKTDAAEAAIMFNITGWADTVANQIAINPDQVHEIKTSRELVLKNLSANFSSAQSWTINTLAALKGYQANYECNWGTEFFTRTEADILALHKQAKEQGLTAIAALYESELTELRMSHNKEKEAKQKIINKINLYKGLSLEQALATGKQSVIDWVLLFPAFISDYEAENGELLYIFSKEVSQAKKIVDIRKDFLNYIKSHEDEQSTIKPTGVRDNAGGNKSNPETNGGATS